MTEELLDENDVYQVRKQKLVDLRRDGFNFPNQFRREHLAQDLMSQYSGFSKEELAEDQKSNSEFDAFVKASF